MIFYVNAAITSANTSNTDIIGTATILGSSSAKPTLRASSPVIVEGQPAVFKFYLDKPAITDVVFDIQTVDINAIAGQDYTASTLNRKLGNHFIFIIRIKVEICNGLF